jgi:uncharacterized protein (DUF58 family)
VRRVLGTAALGLALCLSAAVFDTPSLYLPGVALLVIAFGLSAWVRLAARGANVVRAAGPHTVVEEEAWPLRLEVRTGVLPAPGGELLEPLLGWPLPIAGRWSRRARINVRFSRRGRRRLEPARLVIRDPLRLDAVELLGDGEQDVLVLPRIEPVAPAGEGGGAGRSALDAGHAPAGRSLDRSVAELEIDGLRPYREGAPASRIHWPAVARSGEILERRLIAELESAPLVVLDASTPAGEEPLDAAVRAAGSLCVYLARGGGCAVLLPGERRQVELDSDLVAWPQVHVRLALVEAGGPPPALSRGARGGAVFWVTATSARRPPKVLERIPASARWLVTPAPLPGHAVVFTVAGCSGQRLGRQVRRPQVGRRAA